MRSLCGHLFRIASPAVNMLHFAFTDDGELATILTFPTLIYLYIDFPELRLVYPDMNALGGVR